jgi:hypothetical protein
MTISDDGWNRIRDYNLPTDTILSQLHPPRKVIVSVQRYTASAFKILALSSIQINTLITETLPTEIGFHESVIPTFIEGTGNS